MSTVKELGRLDFDYVVVGGGTAGCVVASRLAESLPHSRILMIEAGPSDLGDKEILDLRNMYNLMGSDSLTFGPGTLVDFRVTTEEVMGSGL